MTVDPPAAAGPTRGPARGDVVPVTGPPDTTEPDYGDLLGTGDPTGRDLRAPLGLGAAVLVAAGTVATLDARRRAALRRAAARSRLDAAAANPLELQLRALDGPARLLRLDLVLRALAAGLRGEQCQPLVVIVHRDGTVRVLLSAAGEPGEPWFADGDGWWVLPGSLADDELVVRGRSSGLPCPAIVHLGDADGADVYLDLEAVGSLTIGGPPAVAASIVDAVALGLALSPFSLDATLTLVGVDERIAEARDGLEIGADVEQATTVARSMLGTIGAATAMGASTFALRARSTVERWEPAIVVLGSGIDAGDDLRELAGTGGRGVGLVTTTTMPTGACLRPGDGGWTLEPWGLTITPVGIAPDDVAAVVDVLDEGERDLLLPPPAGDVPPVDAAAYEDPDWELLVRVLGPVRVHDGAGTDVRFDRNKAQELVCWLALHRERATRTAARTALWEAGVRDATFANVVSDARRNMARLMAPPEGQEWIGRTLTESLVLHPLVRTDADLLAERVAAARAQPADAAIELLRPALALVTDLPFAGTGYVWPDVEGIATELLLLATTAAQELAEHCLAGGDIEGVFWATGQGLRVLPGHEELVALRMRAHARAGDLAGVRAEWGSYERALASDPWCEAEPAAKLVSLRRDLLGAAVDRR